MEERRINMRKLSIFGLVAVAVAANASPVTSFNPMATFGAGGLANGWLENSEHGYTANSTGDRIRGMAYNAVTNKVVIADRSAAGTAALKIHNAITGAYEGNYDMTGVSGGTFGFSKVAIAADGTTYASNLTTNNAGTSTYKIYKWTSPGSAPTVVYNGLVPDPVLGSGNGFRLGDTLDLIGTGANTRLVAGYANSSVAAQTGERGFAIFTDNGAGGLNVNSINTFSPALPGDLGFRQGNTFVTPNSLVGIGDQGFRFASSIDLTTNSANQVVSTGMTGNQRAVDYIQVGNCKLLASIDLFSGSTAAVNDGAMVVRIFDASNPASLGTVVSARAVPLGTLINGNLNQSGEVKWGAVTPAAQGYDLTLYALTTNNGVQAFNVHVVPEPGTWITMGLGALALVARRRKKA